jgi:hypothetical protein
MQTDIQYYHRIAAVTLVSSPFPIPLGIRFQKDGEGEVGCALALLQDLVKQLGKRFFDLVVGDALYLQAPFVKEVEALGLDWACTLKQNQPDLLREAERLTATAAPSCVETVPQAELSVWHVPQVDWPVADRLISVTKTVRTQNVRRVVIENTGDGQKRKKKIPVAIESTNFYASNFQLGSISPTFIHQLGRSRWHIDTELFQTLTTDCHLKHPAVHQSNALVLLTMIRLLAYTLTMVFFYRQVLSHARGDAGTFRNLAKRLADWFLIVALDTG